MTEEQRNEMLRIGAKKIGQQGKPEIIRGIKKMVIGKKKTMRNSAWPFSKD